MLPTIQKANGDSFDINSSGPIVEAGQYWRQLSNGTVLLVASINIIDNEDHSVELYYHPQSRIYGSDKTNRYLINDFYEKFEFVPKAEAEAIRASERDEVQARIEELKNEMLVGYVDENGRSAREEMSQLQQLALPQNIEDRKKAIQTTSTKLQEVAKKQQEFINNKTQAISKHTQLLASYYVEQSSQAIAEISESMKFASRLQKGVRTLEIMTLENVSVGSLHKGASAPEDAKLHFYQRKLFLDEEFMVDLALGGFDYRSFDTFKEALDKDFTVVKRLCPQPLSVALVQPRRKMRSYDNNTFVNAFLNKPNFENFLLVRDGENLYMVTYDELEEIPRLFPTEQEIVSIFKDNKTSLYGLYKEDGSNNAINKNSLKFVEAKDAHASLTTRYRRIMMAISGLCKSDDFEVMNNYKLGRNSLSWFSEEFQRQCVFVHDDEDNLDLMSRSSIQEWIPQLNKSITVGSRVFGNWREVFNNENSKGAYSRGSYVHNTDPERIWCPISNDEPLVVHSEKGRLFVKVPSRYDGWNYDIRGTEKEIKCYIDDELKSISIFHADVAKASDIEYYFNSRKHRESYINYMSLLTSVRNFLLDEEKVQKPFFDKFGDDELLRKTLLDWRRSNNWRIPVSESDFYEIKLKRDYLEELEKMEFGSISDSKSTLVTMDKKNRFHVYNDYASELSSREYFERISYNRVKNGFKEFRRGYLIKTQVPLDENAVQGIIPERTMDGYSNLFDVQVLLKEHSEVNKDLYKAIANREQVSDEHGGLLLEAYKDHVRSARRSIGNKYVYIPVVMLELNQDKEYQYRLAIKYAVCMGYVKLDLAELLASCLSDNLYEEYRAFIDKRFRNPERALGELQNVREGETKASATIQLAYAHHTAVKLPVFRKTTAFLNTLPFKDDDWIKGVALKGDKLNVDLESIIRIVEGKDDNKKYSATLFFKNEYFICHKNDEG